MDDSLFKQDANSCFPPLSFLVCVCVCVCVSIHVCMWVHFPTLCVCLCVCVCSRMCKFMCVCEHVQACCVCVCVRACLRLGIGGGDIYVLLFHCVSSFIHLRCSYIKESRASCCLSSVGKSVRISAPFDCHTHRHAQLPWNSISGNTYTGTHTNTQTHKHTQTHDKCEKINQNSRDTKTGASHTAIQHGRHLSPLFISIRPKTLFAIETLLFKMSIFCITFPLSKLRLAVFFSFFSFRAFESTPLK